MWRRSTADLMLGTGTGSQSADARCAARHPSPSLTAWLPIFVSEPPARANFAGQLASNAWIERGGQGRTQSHGEPLERGPRGVRTRAGPAFSLCPPPTARRPLPTSYPARHLPPTTRPPPSSPPLTPGALLHEQDGGEGGGPPANFEYTTADWVGQKPSSGHFTSGH